MSFINNYDLVSLRDLWSHFDQKMFSKLEHHFIPGSDIYIYFSREMN